MIITFLILSGSVVPALTILGACVVARGPSPPSRMPMARCARKHLQQLFAAPLLSKKTAPES